MDQKSFFAAASGYIPPALYLILCICLAFDPVDRITWFVENLIVWVFLLLVLCTHCLYHKYSRLSLWVIFFACIVHTLGAHYTFQGTPWGEWFSWWGPAERNNFDRFGHFVCGLLALPVMEISVRKKIFAGKWTAAFFAVMTMAGIGAIYEAAEWFYSEATTQVLGESYLGTQGDPWDAQADMLNCLIGAVFAVLLFQAAEKMKNKRG